MIPARYVAPRAQEIFTDETKYRYWKEITDAYALAYAEETDEFCDWIRDSTTEKAFASTAPPTPEMVAEYEADTGHDVVAFLAAYCDKLPESVRYLVHDGLTSSDLVDYGLFQMITDHSVHIERTMGPLCQYFRPGTQFGATAEHIRAGRTHGQIADHTSWEHQIFVHGNGFADIRGVIANYKDYGMVVKSPGPTGWLGADPNLFKRATRVATELSCVITPGTQILHRDRLLEWATGYLRLACALENLAQLVRAGARADVAEVAEGAQRVGSSSMPHKQNPIDCEKVCGMARVARGHVMAIAESVATWDDRDISNSSVERIAVPGLAATVEHMLNSMIHVMDNLVLDPQRMAAKATDPRTFTHVFQVVTQRMLKMDPVEASALVRNAIREYPHGPGFWPVAVRDAVVAKGGDGAEWEAEVNRILDERFGDGNQSRTPG